MVFERIEKAEKLFERSQNLQKSRKGLSKLKRKRSNCRIPCH